MTTDTKKEAILNALSAHIEQRPGLDFANYGNWSTYRSESRSITRDLHHARTLLSAVSWRDGITGDALEAAFRDAFSGRLTCKAEQTTKGWRVRLEYCAGQYFPTEYRKAAAAVLASALWHYTREQCMPEPTIGPDGDRLYKGKRGGDWLRAHFRREFPRAIASRYFN